MTEKLIM